MGVWLLPPRTTCSSQTQQGFFLLVVPVQQSLCGGTAALVQHLVGMHRHPKAGLRNRLAKYVPIVLSSEYRSSQRSACCHKKMTDRPSPRRVTVKQCTSCKTLVSRDVSAACVIHDIFCYQRDHQTDGLPSFIINNSPWGTRCPNDIKHNLLIVTSQWELGLMHWSKMEKLGYLLFGLVLFVMTHELLNPRSFTCYLTWKVYIVR